MLSIVLFEKAAESKENSTNYNERVWSVTSCGRMGHFWNHHILDNYRFRTRAPQLSPFSGRICRKTWFKPSFAERWDSSSEWRTDGSQRDEHTDGVGGSHKPCSLDMNFKSRSVNEDPCGFLWLSMRNKCCQMIKNSKMWSKNWDLRNEFVNGAVIVKNQKPWLSFPWCSAVQFRNFVSEFAKIQSVQIEFSCSLCVSSKCTLCINWFFLAKHTDGASVSPNLPNNGDVSTAEQWNNSHTDVIWIQDIPHVLAHVLFCKNCALHQNWVQKHKQWSWIGSEHGSKLEFCEIESSELTKLSFSSSSTIFNADPEKLCGLVPTCQTLEKQLWLQWLSLCATHLVKWNILAHQNVLNDWFQHSLSFHCNCNSQNFLTNLHTAVHCFPMLPKSFLCSLFVTSQIGCPHVCCTNNPFMQHQMLCVVLHLAFFIPKFMICEFKCFSHFSKNDGDDNAKHGPFTFQLSALSGTILMKILSERGCDLAEKWRVKN